MWYHFIMSIITLTTDFGIKDYMVASVKGAILGNLPEARLVDITHQISPFDREEAAYVVKNAYPDFPRGTIHIIGVDALPSENTKLIAAKIDEHYFISADNGILSLILSELRPEILVEITLGRYNAYSNFPTRDIFVPVACHLARGGKLEIIGKPIKDYVELSTIKPVLTDEKTLLGTVIYIDNFGNVISNISQKKFNEVKRGRGFQINVRHEKFKEVFSKYSDVVKDYEKEVYYHGKTIALFNSAGFLEIAVYKSNPNTFGSASTLLGLSKGDQISITFN